MIERDKRVNRKRLAGVVSLACRVLMVTTVLLAAIVVWIGATHTRTDVPSVLQHHEGDLSGYLENGEPTGFNFAVAGDTKDGTTMFESILRRVREQDPLFLVICGDFVDHDRIPNYNFFISEVMETDISTPIFLIAGNHEYTGHPLKEHVGSTHFSEFFGPTHYWFSYGDSLFIVVDDALERIEPQQLAWLEGVLEKQGASHELIFVFMHIPPVPVYDGDGRNKGIEEPVFTRLMAEQDVNAVFCGHLHGYRHEIVDGVHYYVTGGGGAALQAKNEFHHFLNVSVRGDDVSVAVERMPQIPGVSSFLEDRFEDAIVKHVYPAIVKVPLFFSVALLLELTVLVAVARLCRRMTLTVGST